MKRPPVSGALLNRTVAWRSFALLGPTEALMAMVAFIAVLLAGGWVGEQPPSRHLLAQASGAYFITVVTGSDGQRLRVSQQHPHRPDRLGLFTNPTLVWAVLVALCIALAMIFVAPLADLLGQAPPSTVGWLIATAAPVVLLRVDAGDKAWRGGGATELGAVPR